MKRPGWWAATCIVALGVAAFIGCETPDKPEATLEITLSSRDLPADGTTATVTVTATGSDGKPGTGNVALTASAGSLDSAGLAANLTLADGVATATYSCDASARAGCRDVVRIAAEWNGTRAQTGVAVGDPSGSGTDGGTPRPDGGIAHADVYTLSKYVESPPWTGLMRTAAIDSQERLYVVSHDQRTVYQISQGAPVAYLDMAELEEQGGYGSNTMHVVDLDVGPDDTLYLMVDGTGLFIYQSSAAHAFAVKHDLTHAMVGPIPWVMRMGVLDADRILIMGEGMFEVAGDGTVTQRYGTDVVSFMNCFLDDFAVLRSGYLFFTEGCNGSPVMGGPNEDGGFEVQFDADQEMTTGNTSGFAREGNSIVVNAETDLYRVTPGGSYHLLKTTPSVQEVATNAHYSDFYNFDVAVGPTGNIYLVGTDIFVARVARP